MYKCPICGYAADKQDECPMCHVPLEEVTEKKQDEIISPETGPVPNGGEKGSPQAPTTYQT